MSSPESAGRGPATSVVLHASSIAVGGKAVLILGPSGSGKSSLALDLMAFGADLVADDQTMVSEDRVTGLLVAEAPETLPAKIEARGVGLLPAKLCGRCNVVLAVDLGEKESARLPPSRSKSILGHSVALLHGTDNAHFPQAVLQYLKGLGSP